MLEGLKVGLAVGLAVGFRVGINVGCIVGKVVGKNVGSNVGAGDGNIHGVPRLLLTSTSPAHVYPKLLVATLVNL